MKFIIEQNQLTIQLEGLEKFWALKSRLQIPAYAIADITFVNEKPVMKDQWSFFRFPGARIPGVLLAGTYLRRGERDFWYLNYRQVGVLTIMFKPQTLNYDRVVLSCKRDIAEQLAAWWHQQLIATAE
jgi:hypothetical protein